MKLRRISHDRWLPANPHNGSTHVPQPEAVRYIRGLVVHEEQPTLEVDWATWLILCLAIGVVAFASYH
jgi:hypothetical protein